MRPRRSLRPARGRRAAEHLAKEATLVPIGWVVVIAFGSLVIGVLGTCGVLASLSSAAADDLVDEHVARALADPEPLDDLIPEDAT